MNIEFERLLLFPRLKPLLELQGETFYLVGGCVRDLFLGRGILDIDLLVEQAPSQIINQLLHIRPPKKRVRSLFLTEKLIYEDFEIDIAHARVEEYLKSALLPRVEPCYSAVKDLKRRDFTINSMAIRIYPKPHVLLDPLDGYSDLKNRILRVNKVGSFRDDPTRAFRAIRYRNRFKLKYSEETEREFENALMFLKDVSFERVKKEIQKCAKEKERYNMFKEVADRGLLRAFKEELNQSDLELLNYLHEVVPYEERFWFYFLIPFGLYKFFEKNMERFTAREKRVIYRIFNVKKEELFRKDLLRLFKDTDEIALRVWAKLNGLNDLDLIR